MFLGYARVVSVLKVCPIEFSMVKCFISVITKTNVKRKTGQHLIAWHSNQIEIDIICLENMAQWVSLPLKTTLYIEVEWFCNEQNPDRLIVKSFLNFSWKLTNIQHFISLEINVWTFCVKSTIKLLVYN